MMMGVRSPAAQPAADRQAVLARQHQVEHDQVDVLARHQPVQRLAVLGQQDVETFLAQVAAQQVADAGVIVEDDDAVLAGAWNGRHDGSKYVTGPILRGRNPV
jgi:hypothetical protein